MHLTNIAETCLYCPDLESAENFYSNILNLKLIGKQEGRHLFYQLDSGNLFIFNPAQSVIDSGKVPPHGTTGSGHLAFGINKGVYEGWKQYLKSKEVEIEKEVEWPTAQKSLYFRDPSGNVLEMITSKLIDNEETLQRMESIVTSPQ